MKIIKGELGIEISVPGEELPSHLETVMKFPISSMLCMFAQTYGVSRDRVLDAMAIADPGLQNDINIAADYLRQNTPLIPDDLTDITQAFIIAKHYGLKNIAVKLFNRNGNLSHVQFIQQPPNTDQPEPLQPWPWLDEQIKRDWQVYNPVTFICEIVDSQQARISLGEINHLEIYEMPEVISINNQFFINLPNSTQHLHQKSL